MDLPLRGAALDSLVAVLCALTGVPFDAMCLRVWLDREEYALWSGTAQEKAAPEAILRCSAPRSRHWRHWGTSACPEEFVPKQQADCLEFSDHDLIVN